MTRLSAMLRGLFGLAFLVLSGGLLSACQPAPEPYDVPERARPALWRVEGKAQGNLPAGTAWLFGTIHLLPADVAWRTPRIDKAVAASDLLLLEVAGLEDRGAVDDAFVKLGRSPGQPPLLSRLPADLADEAREMAHEGGLSMATLDGMESWAAALMFASTAHASLGLRQEDGVEYRLTKAFQARGAAIAGLETAEAQLALFDRLPESDQRAMLKSVLEGGEDSRAEFQALLTAWLSGDDAMVLDLSSRDMMALPHVREALLVRRNRNWTDQLARRLARGEKLFVAVGAAHLAGSDGLPALLRARGFTVTRVQ